MDEKTLKSNIIDMDRTTCSVTGTGSGLLGENPQSGCTEIRASLRATIGVLTTYATR
jgi:hypothetical protein